MFESGLLAGKRILVTGGGSGLGLAMALRFAQLGANLVICGRRESMLEDAAQRIRAASRERNPDEVVQPMVCDIRDASAVQALFDRIWSVGPLQVLVNNAAATFLAQTEHLSARAVDADWIEVGSILAT